MIQVRMTQEAPWWIVLGALVLGVPLLVALLALVGSERTQRAVGTGPDSAVEQGAESDAAASHR